MNKVQNKKSFQDLTCYNCGKKGHTSKFCRFNKKFNELGLEEEVVNKIQELYIDSESSELEITESENQIDELGTSSSEKSVNVLTKEQSSLLELINNIEDSTTKEKFLKKIIKSFDEAKEVKNSIPKIEKQTYDLTKILGKNKKPKETVSIEDLQKEIRIIKTEVKDLKDQLQKNSKRIKFLEE